MRKNVWIFGGILGLILCINMVIMVNAIVKNPSFKSYDLIGYAVMIVVYSLIFFGVRNYRNKFLDGFISFGKAFKTGFYITLVASTMYVVVWLFYYYLFVPEFIDRFIEHALYQTNSEAEMVAKKQEMENLKDLYQNPLLVIVITLSEVLPIGVIISLVSALILKRKKKPNDV